MKVKNALWLLATAAVFAACDNPLDTSPTDAIAADDALKNAREVGLAINGIYDALQATALYSRELIAYPEMYADNLRFTGTYGTDGEVANRDISPTNGAIENAWVGMYRAISRANYVLAALDGVDDLTDEQRDAYRGEALFLRALNYFNAVRYWGDVPLILEPANAVSEESKVARSPAADVYAQIEADLNEAVGLLPPSAVGRASAGAAWALLARAHLEQGEWQAASDAATEVIDGGEYELVDEYGDIFAVRNSAESIFELQYSINDANSLAFWFFTQSVGGRWGFAPTDDLIAAYEPGDERLAASIARDGSDRPYGIKYFRIANGDDNVSILRLSEMYLIRAEANARMGAPADVVRADIDAVRTRAGLAALPTTVDTEDELIDAILQERRLEFAMEGYRFFDLRRTGRAQAVLGIDATRLLFPIPQAERDVNENLTQNPGY